MLISICYVRYLLIVQSEYDNPGFISSKFMYWTCFISELVNYYHSDYKMLHCNIPPYSHLNNELLIWIKKWIFNITFVIVMCCLRIKVSILLNNWRSGLKLLSRKLCLLLTNYWSLLILKIIIFCSELLWIKWVLSLICESFIGVVIIKYIKITMCLNSGSILWNQFLPQFKSSNLRWLVF